MTLSDQQSEALTAVKDWIADPDKQVFRLFGYAGTGKTSIAKEFATTVGGTVLYACFTGKAALVLQQKGCPATTIHRLIYVPAPKSTERLEDLECELAELQLELRQWPDDPSIIDGVAKLEREIDKENKIAKQPRFAPNPDSDLHDAALLVIDEVSMVGKAMALDLLKFDVKILVLGDPAQLPPVGEAGFFTKADPDFMLTEVHRQAAESPVLQLATLVRGRKPLEQGDYGESRVVPKGALKIGEVAKFDQILCGTNKARHDINRQVREELGFKTHLPEEGDKLVCLRNDYDRGLLNGSQWKVLSALSIDADRIQLDLLGDDGSVQCLTTWTHYFEQRESELKPWDMRTHMIFDFAYAMTVHKAQGSSWPHVLVIDESKCFRHDASRWLYTALTRASESVTVVQP